MTDQRKKHIQAQTRQNVIEVLKDFGTQTSKDFLSELVGFPKPQKKVTGEIGIGESLNINEALIGKSEENKKLRAQIALERNLANKEKRLSDEKIGKLRLHLQALASEIAKLSLSNQKLAMETQNAVMEIPINPGIYHIAFFEKLIIFMQSFRKKIEEAATWLQASSKRSEKKNYWNMYKKKGSSFLLSPDHYLQRSAG